MTLPNGSLMVTEDGDGSVGSVVGEELLGDGSVGGSESSEFLFHRVRGVVGTEDFG